MTARLPFTQARIERAIKAAQKLGLRVTGIRPDGTVLVQEGDAPVVPLELGEQNGAASRWAEVKA
jgi:hypothetical protein